MPITLKICEDEKEWDNLVDKSTYATIFHTWKFLKIIEKHTGTKLYPVIGFNDNLPIGMYPLFFQKKFVLRMVFSPPPHCALTYLGPLIADSISRPEGEKVKRNRDIEGDFILFQEKVDEFISKDLKANYISITLPPNAIDTRPLKWNGYCIKPSYSYLLDLNPGLECVWKNLKKTLRQNINKTERAGVVIREGTEKEVEFLYSLMNVRYEQQDKVVTVPFDYIKDLYEAFTPDIFKIYVAEYNNEILTGVIDLHYKGRIITWIGNPKTALKGIQPNDLLIWETIKRGYQEGLRKYEVIGAAGVQRLYSYHQKYNPELVVNFSATRYDSNFSKMAEFSYLKIFKPVYTKVKLLKRIFKR